MKRENPLIRRRGGRWLAVSLLIGLASGVTGLAAERVVLVEDIASLG